MKGKNFPMYMACGTIFMSTSLGLLTAVQELAHAPNVLVNKKKRKEVPEVEEPDYVLHKSQQFVNNSVFRKLGTNSKFYHDLTRVHVQTLLQNCTPKKGLHLKIFDPSPGKAGSTLVNKD